MEPILKIILFICYKHWAYRIAAWYLFQEKENEILGDKEVIYVPQVMIK